MDEKKIEESLSELLPDRAPLPGEINAREIAVKAKAREIRADKEVAELRKLKAAEKARLKRAEANQAKATEMGITLKKGQKLKDAEKAAYHRERVEALEAIEAEVVQPLDVNNIAKAAKASGKRVPAQLLDKALQLQGTSRPEMTKLLTSLGINLSVQLTKQDTANLLACLLTCNETQLEALKNNSRVPVVIKAVINRLKQDMTEGKLNTIEMLWDRIFGNGPMSLDLPKAQQVRTGILPDVPVSREAYVVIRDTLMK